MTTRIASLEAPCDGHPDLQWMFEPLTSDSLARMRVEARGDATRRTQMHPDAARCIHGHEWTEATVYRSPRGVQICRACRLDQQRVRRRAQRNERRAP